MRRVVAVLLAQALVMSSAVVSSLHVHDYTEHDHPTHHHGPALHDHASVLDHDHDLASSERGPASAALESCDPGRHAVAVKMGAAPLPEADVAVSEVPAAADIVPAARTQFTLSLTDVRAHGPPFDARVPSRAPPLHPHA